MADTTYISASAPAQADLAISGEGGGSGKGAVRASSRSRRNYGSKIKMDHGDRQMRAYPITETELRLINWTSFIATICFSLASGMLGFYISTEQAIAFAGDTQPMILDRWKTYQTMACYFGIVFLVGGAGSVFFGTSMKKQIREETTFY